MAKEDVESRVQALERQLKAIEDSNQYSAEQITTITKRVDTASKYYQALEKKVRDLERIDTSPEGLTTLLQQIQTIKKDVERIQKMNLRLFTAELATLADKLTNMKTEIRELKKFLNEDAPKRMEVAMKKGTYAAKALEGETIIKEACGRLSVLDQFPENIRSYLKGLQYKLQDYTVKFESLEQRELIRVSDDDRVERTQEITQDEKDVEEDKPEDES